MTATGPVAVLVTRTETGIGTGTDTAAVPVATTTRGRKDNWAASGLWTLVLWHHAINICKLNMIQNNRHYLFDMFFFNFALFHVIKGGEGCVADWPFVPSGCKESEQLSNQRCDLQDDTQCLVQWIS